MYCLRKILLAVLFAQTAIKQLKRRAAERRGLSFRSDLESTDCWVGMASADILMWPMQSVWLSINSYIIGYIEVDGWPQPKVKFCAIGQLILAEYSFWRQRSGWGQRSFEIKYLLGDRVLVENRTFMHWDKVFFGEGYSSGNNILHGWGLNNYGA